MIIAIPITSLHPSYITLKFVEFTSYHIKNLQEFNVLWWMPSVMFPLTFITPVVKKLVQTVTVFLKHVLEVPGQILATTSTTLTELFSVFLNPFRQMSRQYLTFGHNHFLLHTLQFTIRWSLYHSSVQSQLLTVSLNTP
jgi:hypothetical protein